jgi:predicted O-methyltransferase YrrM
MLWRNIKITDEITHANDFFFDQIGVPHVVARARALDVARQASMPDVMGEKIQYVAFAALSLAGFKPENVLELGTSHGQGTAMLAELFPTSTVHTVELPANDPLFKSMRAEGDGAYTRVVAPRIDRPNIRAYRANTLHLPTLGFPDFDLIWLDAGHNFPEVAWDHFFSLSKLRRGGWLFSDDVTKPDNGLTRYRRDLLDPWTVMEYIAARSPDKFRYLLKRSELQHHIMNRKFVGVLHKQRTPQS